MNYTKIFLLNALLICFLYSCGQRPSSDSLQNKQLNNTGVLQKNIDTGVVPHGNIPQSFIITVPLNINGKDLSFGILCKRGDVFMDDSTNYSATASISEKNILLPDVFYNIVESNFSLMPLFINYKEAYKFFKSTNFIANNLVKKGFLSAYIDSPAMINITDINDDKHDEIILQDIEASTKGNEAYRLFSKSAKEENFMVVPDFFNGTFVGLDKTGKYIITVSNNNLDNEATYFRNKIVKNKLVPVEKCIVEYNSDKRCFE